MPPPKKGSKQPQGSGNELRDALKEYGQQRSTRIKKEKRQGKLRKMFGWLQAAPGWAKAVLITVVVVLLALVADGLRRERGEFNATLATVTGQVTVAKGGEGSGTPAQAAMALENKDVVRTGRDSGATLVFPDGSAIQLEESTEFEVRLLDYARGGQRDRSFMVRAGSAVANVSKFFGVGSQATVCTPTAVAAVRGTGFRVTYDPAKKQSYVQVVHGAVDVRTAAGRLPAPAQGGQMVMATGYQIDPTRQLPKGRETAVGGQLGQMTRYETEPGFLDRIEMAINSFLDPALQILGLAPGSWSYATNNFARKAACMEALRRLHIHISQSGEGGETPEFLNPVTLEELNQDPREVKKLVDTFSGGMLELYRKTGKDQFVAQARARNRGHTLYEVDETGGVHEVKE
jgi:ferric-dicitrate binding protein FerR (iron transport regulator)